MSANYTIYIDEAGDLGVGRGTQWFVISAVAVRKEDEEEIRSSISHIKTKFNLKEIHLRKIHDFYKISYIVSEIKDKDFMIFNVLMDTNKCKVRDSVQTYNYMCRILLERVSWFLRDNKETADIMLSSRGTSRDAELINYIKEKLLTYPGNEVENVFEKITSKTASKWDMLQLVDICATSLFKAYEINHLGFVTPCFMNNLRNKIYRRNNDMDKYGLKFYTEDMKPSSDYFQGHLLCNKK